MTIKQQGGIFGRNPTFNDVSATDAEITNQLDVKTISMVSNNPLIYLDDTDVADNNTRLRNQSGIFRIQDVADDGSTTTQVQLAHSTGDLTVSTGNLVIGTSGKGIDFSATSGTGTSELFDDYEEGTWTPTVGGTASYNASNYGRYTKVGNIVSCQFRIDINVLGTGSTGVLSGFPFSSANLGTGLIQSGSCSYYAGLAANSIYLSFYLDNNAATAQFVNSTASGAAVNNAIGLFGNSATVAGSITYISA